MASFFPHVTGAFKLEEPPALRRFTMSPIAMGVVTGVAVRLYRTFTLTVGPSESLLYFGAALVFGQLILLSMVTLHVGNFTLRRWLSLVPVFAICEVAAECLLSLALVAIGLERVGSRRALLSDWPGIALSVGGWRLVTLVLYVTLLAGIVQLVRYFLLRKGHREHTLDAVTHEHGTGPKE